MIRNPKQVLSLCPDCSACPAVEVYDDSVRIGEEPRVVTLSAGEWNQLVKAVQRGDLTEITQSTDRS